MVFVKKTGKKKDSDILFPLSHYTGTRDLKGDYGVELEFEGVNFRQYFGDKQVKGWLPHEDGSLRGRPESIEMIFNGPKEYDEGVTLINDLFNAFDTNNTRPLVSNRTSMHVHVNAGKWYVPRLAAFSLIYFTFEEVLSLYAGQERAGNLFCVRGIDAPYVVDTFEEFIKEYNTRFIQRDNVKYSGLNLSPILTKGSVEVRLMRGPVIREEALDWFEIIHKLNLAGNNYRANPSLFCNEFSLEGCYNVFGKILGKELADKIIDKIEFTEADFINSAYKGMRNAQALAYARNWPSLQENKPDPFKRGVQTTKLNREEVLRRAIREMGPAEIDFAPLRPARLEPFDNAEENAAFINREDRVFPDRLDLEEDEIRLPLLREHQHVRASGIPLPPQGFVWTEPVGMRVITSYNLTLRPRGEVLPPRTIPAIVDYNWAGPRWNRDISGHIYRVQPDNNFSELIIRQIREGRLDNNGERID